MAARPFWSGQFKVSLVSFGIQLFPATETARTITFHQLDRETGQRIRHLNVTGDNEPVENADIVKGFEYTKGKYLVIEPDEIAKLRIPTKSVIDVQQFVDLSSIPLALFEKPYFVVPEAKEGPEAFAVVHEAMEKSGKAAIGEITFGGREHLVAIAADRGAHMMAYVLRYGEELRAARDYAVPAAAKATVDKKQLAMATQLIEAYSHPLDLDAFKDDYESALRELIEAKQKDAPLPAEEENAAPTKVVNLMDALRDSVAKVKKPVASERRAASAARKGPVLVRPARRKHKVA